MLRRADGELRSRIWPFLRSSLPGVVWLGYEVMTLRNIVQFFGVTAAIGFSGERYLSYVSRQVFLNPVVRGLDNVFSAFDRCFLSFAASFTAAPNDPGLDVFLYQTLNVIVLDVVLGGAFWFLIFLAFLRIRRKSVTVPVFGKLGFPPQKVHPPGPGERSVAGGEDDGG